MEEKTSKEELSGAAQASVAQDAAGDTVRPDPDLTRICCGSIIEPQLAKRRDHLGETLLVTVWRCPRCGRLTD